ncbi:unnamed protein product [Psylliodes chrysocephalus]|uniref:Uncharacterized protein n=1 Tax=Psylliodes chrysocephalus TaxID=3402493 RepID=A0A9P0CRA5_9CUCU|nr:unnamed protein product [Psylliodes chrysocephala]
MEEAGVKVADKKINPRDRTNIVSSLFFCWLIPYFVKGYKRELTEDDMYMHRKDHDSGDLGKKLEMRWKKHLENNKNPSFLRVLLGTFIYEVVLLNILSVVAEMIKMAQPFLISKLLLVYERMTSEGANEVYIYSSLIVLSQFLNVICTHKFILAMNQVAMKFRIASCSLIYRKSLKLSKSALAETTIGQMVNLLSNDVGRFDLAVHRLHYVYLAPIQTLVVMCLLYINIGLTALSGALFLLLSIPLQFWLGKKTSQYRLTVAGLTDERVRLMNEIIAGIQVIKMYTWEYPFAKIVEIVRLKEMKYVRLTSRIRAILMSMGLMMNRCAVAISIVVYAFTGNPLTASYAYTVTSFYELLYTLTMFFPQAISQGSEMYISLKRIQQFLLFDEIEFEKNTLTNSLVVHSKDLKPTLLPESLLKGPDANIKIKNASAKWLKSLPDNSLDDINLDIKAGDCVAVVGGVGSGKSTLLHVVMRELELQSGSVQIKGVVSYASQEPWLFGGSVRQNILFGQKFEQKRYDEVIRVCALRRDFTLFPHGDRTLVGERGVSLSGGQRARINLARAVYKEADIYLLDDPLSAVDAHVGKQLFDDCITSYLHTKCVILVTHQLQYLKKIEKIYLMNDGRIEISGSYEDIKKSNTEYSKLLANIEEEEEEQIRKKSRIAVVKQEEDEENDIQVLKREDKGTGKITGRVYISYARAGGHLFKVFLLIFCFILGQALDSVTEYYVTFWVNIEQWKSQHTPVSGISNFNEAITTNITLSSLNLTTLSPLIPEENPFEGWWLTPVFTSEYVAYFYSSIVILVVVIVILRSLAFYQWCMTASTQMHNKMFVNIVYSPMRFFNLNPSGRILNRFSKDIGTLDEILPMTLLDTVQIGLSVAAISLVIGSLTVWIFIPTLLIGVLFYIMRVVFLETSRDIKRVESVTRSPIYTHLAASLTGLTTIRAFKAQEILKDEFDKFQNLNSAAFFMYVGANRTFGFWLDFLCVIYVALVIVSLLFLKSEQFGGNMGLALTQAMGLTGMFQWGMRQWSELENQMTSVERVQEYADLKQEEDNTTYEPPADWPSNGEVEFSDMSLHYSPDDPPVLKNLSFTIKPNEKIGIVGRTGAGKSSLIQALFRLTYIDGKILLDGVDTKTVSLKKLRSKISIIPQEPVLFSGALRKNLDPFDEYKDEDLWNALDEVELKNAVNELPAGLDSKIAEGGSNFSVGQRQLVCLARAIVRNNKILVLDEATANIDPHTDGLIQTTIRKKFANCTVLTIAHRLHTIMDSDKVLVMDAGRSVEFDHPHTLLQDKQGIFYSLVQQTGRSTAKTLTAIAESSYNFENAQTS